MSNDLDRSAPGVRALGQRKSSMSTCREVEDEILTVCSSFDKLVPLNALAALSELVQLDLRAAEAVNQNQNELRRMLFDPRIRLSRVEFRGKLPVHCKSRPPAIGARADEDELRRKLGSSICYP